MPLKDRMSVINFYWLVRKRDRASGEEGRGSLRLRSSAEVAPRADPALERSANYLQTQACKLTESQEAHPVGSTAPSGRSTPTQR